MNEIAEKYSTLTDEIKVQGMICRACEDAVCEALLQTRGVVSCSASYWKGVVTVEYDPAIITRDQLSLRLEQSGYPEGGGASGVLVDIICLGLVALLTWFFMNVSLVKVPEAASATDLWQIFVIGLLTSTHCIGMCGGILLAQTTDPSDLTADAGLRAKRGVKASLSYNLGRLLSYTLVGGVFGALGSVLTYSMTVKSMVFTIAGALVALIGLSMSGAVPFLRRLSLDLPGSCSLPGKARRGLSGKPLVVGILTGVMPCAALYAMWIYAMSAGSFLMGAVSMLVFTLGTVPLLFLFGALGSFVPKKWMKYMLKFSAVLIISLGLKMLIKGLSMM